MAEIATRPVIDLASPAECAARTARIEAASTRQRTRLTQMCEARELRRKNEILTKWELLNELNSMMSAMRCAPNSDMERWKCALVEVACDLEDDICKVWE